MARLALRSQPRTAGVPRQVCPYAGAMLLVGLTRFGPRDASNEHTPRPAALESEATALAPALGLGIYEARLALAAAPPTVLLSTEDTGRARDLAVLLRTRGHGAVACDASAVASSDRMVTPRELRFEADRLVVDGGGVSDHATPWKDVLLLVEATHAREEESTEEHTVRKFDLGRAVLTGGIVRNRSTTATSRQASEERERVLYVVVGDAGRHVLLRENRLRYGGLGDRMGRTVGESFTALRAMLRERAAGARFDDRLVRARRAASRVQITGTSRAPTVSRSNAWDTDVAVHLLAVAHLQDQL